MSQVFVGGFNCKISHLICQVTYLCYLRSQLLIFNDFQQTSGSIANFMIILWKLFVTSNIE